MNEKKKKIGFILILIASLLIPGLQVLFIIGMNSKYLIRLPFFIIIIILLIALFVALIYGINIFIKNRKANKRKLKKWIKVVFIIFMSFYIIGCTTFTFLLYGNNDKFRTWLITTAMQTMDHQYLCKWFYNDEQINYVMNQNYVKESGESTNSDLIDKKKPVKPKDEYDKQILDVEEGTKYKIIQFEVDGQRAFLAAVYDPSMIKIEVTDQIGVLGEYVTRMAQRNNAILAVNGGGFVDAGYNLGESPTGITIKNGQIITDNNYGGTTSSGGVVGFNNDDVLMLLKVNTAQEAIDMGIRDAVSWGPFLIVNGVPSEVSGNGGWGFGARTAIGQRADGIVLFLVVESNAARTSGATMADLRDIMVRYHAVNAANMDGGTSSLMALPRDIAINEYGATCHDYFTQYACAINDPIDSTGTHQTRYIADAWIVVDNEAEETKVE